MATICGCVYDPPMEGTPFLAVLMADGRVVSAGSASSEDEAYDLLVQLLTEHAEKAEPARPVEVGLSARSRSRLARY